MHINPAAAAAAAAAVAVVTQYYAMFTAGVLAELGSVSRRRSGAKTKQL